MNDKRKKTLNTAVIFIILVSIWALFFITGISSFPLYPPDEPKYANAAYNMLDSGDFLTPFFNDRPRFDKPPLIYWLIALSYSIFGVSDWAARIPSIVSTLGVMVFIYLFSKKKFGYEAGLLSVLVFSGIFHVWVMGRAVAPETAMVLFEVVALYFFYNGIERQNRIFIYAGYFGLSMAFLTKGPVGVIIPLGIIMIYFAFSIGIRETVKRIFSPAGILIFVLIGFPWYILMFRKYGYAYFQEFFLFHNFYRFTGAVHQHHFKFYYYIPIFLGSLYLWFPFARKIKNHLKEVISSRSSEIFFVIWLLFPLLFFTISVNKLHNYILICYPAVAIISGNCLSRIEQISKTVKRLFIGVAIIEVCIFGFALYSLKYNRGLIITGGIIILLISTVMIFKATSIRRISILTALKGFCILLLVTGFSMTYKQNMNEAYARINYEANIEKEKIYFYKHHREDFIFYNNISVSCLENKKELKEIMDKYSEIVLILKDEDLKDFQEIPAKRILTFNDFIGNKTFSIIEVNSS